MNSAKMVLTEAVAMPELLVKSGKISDASDEKKMQFAKDFESVFIERLFKEMKKTIGEWGFDKEGTTDQINGIFWIRHVTLFIPERTKLNLECPAH